MGRTWTTPPRAALTFSLLVRPAQVPAARRGWLPLLTGVAVTEAITSLTGVPAKLKWPNDVLASTGKLVGILAEAAADAIVVGIGVNVSTEPGELPERGPGALPATSLLIAGAPAEALDRGPLLLAILAAFEDWYLAWRQANGDPEASGLRARYTELSGTIGRHVRAELPGGQALSGPAVGVDADGRLLVGSSAGTGTVPVAAADVVHLR
jgi:BirA family biotin operon repressor/biotin-[acetyl-CoA-carboxylase] ligase